MTAAMLDEAAARIRAATGRGSFEQAVILGSGLAALANEIVAPCRIPYRELACLPQVAAVAGQGGEVVVGTLDGIATLVFVGRFHLYQGLSAAETALPVRLAARLGVRRLLLTNAAGGINGDYAPGDFMFINDHLNLTGDNPLRGLTPPPFADLTALYRRELLPALHSQAGTSGILLHDGVYAAVAGPSYETPAEVRALAQLGADAVGMSTVAEAICAAACGLTVAGLSLIANRAAGLSPRPLSHAEVLAIGRERARPFAALCRQLLAEWRNISAPRQ